MRIKVTSKGNSGKTVGYLTRLLHRDYLTALAHYGEIGIAALEAATPVDTGRAAGSWRYRITNASRGRTAIEWYNVDEEGGVSVAVLIQYGHGTGTGGYVAGRDYINPAMRRVFDQIADDIWRKVVG